MRDEREGVCKTDGEDEEEEKGEEKEKEKEEEGTDDMESQKKEKEKKRKKEKHRLHHSPESFAGKADVIKRMKTVMKGGSKLILKS